MKKIILSFIIFISLINYSLGQSYQWGHAIGSGASDNSYNLTVDDSGNTYVVGRFQGSVDFDPSASSQLLSSQGGFDMFLMKFDGTGNLIWVISAGGTGTDDASGVTVDKNGNVYITGRFQNTVDFDPSPGIFNLTSNGSWDAYTAKYDKDGNLKWAIGFGDANFDDGKSIALSQDSFIYVTGSFEGTIDFDTSMNVFNVSSIGDKDAFLAKYDFFGNFIWAINFGGFGTEIGYGVDSDTSGNVYLTGSFTANIGVILFSVGNSDIFISKFDKNGVFLWAKSDGVSTNDRGTSVDIDQSENVLITGDRIISKYNSNGDSLWTINMIGSNITGLSVTTGYEDAVYVSGHFFAILDFDTLTAEDNLITNGMNDIFLVKYDSSGNFIWSYNIGDASSQLGNAISADNFGNIFISGGFKGSPDFNPATSLVKQLVTNGNFDVFVAKYRDTSIVACALNTEVIICEGDSVFLSGNYQLASGVYSDTLFGGGNLICDSIVNITLTVLPNPVISNTTVSICTGDSILLGGAFQTSPGNYNDTLFGGGFFGCDSLIISTLTLFTNPVISNQNISLCSGDSILLEGAYQFSTGVYSDTLITTNGCDSIISTNLTVSICLGLNNNLHSQILEIYPNPVFNYLTIKTNIKILEIELFDVYGRKIDFQTKVNYNRLNLEGLDKGIYFLKVYSEEAVKTQKFIKQ
jgi:Secretion system C-terminal sorting domain/Beta-propeller repeat